MLDGEHRIAVHAMQGNQASSRGKGKSHGSSRVAVGTLGIFSIAAGTWGIFLSYVGDGPSKLVFVQQRQDSCLVTRDTSGIP